MSCLAELSNEHLDISESLMLSASSNLFTLITLLFLFTRLKHKTKCLCENIFKNFHANSWQPLKKVAFSWHLNNKQDINGSLNELIALVSLQEETNPNLISDKKTY